MFHFHKANEESRGLLLSVYTSAFLWLASQIESKILENTDGKDATLLDLCKLFVQYFNAGRA